MKQQNSKRTTAIIILGTLILVCVMVVGTILTGQSAKHDTDRAVSTVSLMFMDELAGRRKQVVENDLENKIYTMQVAIDLMDEEDLSDEEHLAAYQKRMKQLFKLDKFAFVDTDGTIYTSLGTQDNIGDYGFEYKNLTKPEISLFNSENGQQQVIIAVPVDLQLDDKNLSVCFMAINMDEMLSAVSVSSDVQDTTFCNIYTRDGHALTDSVLGGLAAEDNLISAMQGADFEEPDTFDSFVQSFSAGEKGTVSFT